MPTVVDYTSLGKAILDFTHRPTLATYQDYFIQGAQESIMNDIADMNFGNGVRYAEVPYGPVTINGGTTPVPTDWWNPKVMLVSDGSSDTFPLNFKAAAWLYDQYPVRQAYGLPSFIARDVMAPCSFAGAISAGVLTVSAVSSGVIQTGMILADSGGPLPETVTGAVTVTGFISGTGGAGTYSVSNTTISVGLESMTGGGQVFIYGPYPDSAYTVTGTYYSQGTQLSPTNTTNWMTQFFPTGLTAACIRQAALFLENDQQYARWDAVYKEKLKSMVDADKAERFASSTLQIDIG